MGNTIDSSDASSRSDATEQVPKDRLAPLPSANPNFSAAHLPGTERAHSTSSQIALQQQIPDKGKISVSNNVPLHGLSDQESHNLSAGSCMVRPELEYISHDATELSDYLSNRLAKRYLYASGEGQFELLTLRETVGQYTPYLNLPDLSYMKPEHMWPLLRSFNTAFFAGMVRLKSAEQFKWLDIADHRILAMCTTNHASPTIYLHPWRLDQRKRQAEGHDPHFPIRDRLSSILHELCHALFISNCAPDTSSWHCGVGKGGHGPAWRRIAYTIEEVSILTLGFQLDLGRDVNRIFDAEYPGNFLSRLKAHTPSSRSILCHESLDMTLPYDTSPHTTEQHQTHRTDLP